MTKAVCVINGPVNGVVNFYQNVSLLFLILKILMSNFNYFIKTANNYDYLLISIHAG